MTKGIVSFFALLALVAAGFFVIKAACFTAGTALEREVFEQSFQYQAARSAEVVTYEAELASIDAQLSDTTLSATTRAQLTGQRRAISTRLDAARRRQK